MRLQLTLGVLALTACTAMASPYDLATATDLFTPSFRGDASTTYLGWDSFGERADTVLNDSTPDVGTGSGSFVTTNGEDHQSGSLNYYTGGGSVAEDISFATDGTTGSGFTTVIVQASTLFGGWGSEIDFGSIDGVEPSLVVQATNAMGSGQLFVKYELPGTTDVETFSIGQELGGDPTSFGLFVVDSVWSPSGFAADTAIATPEPAAVLLTLLGLVAASASTRR